MVEIDGSRLGQVLEVATIFGESWAVQRAQKSLVPHVLTVFASHGREDVERMIITGYPLVERHTPTGVRTAMGNLSNNESTREFYHQLVVQYITPENVLSWMSEPEEWLTDPEAEEQRSNLRETAAAIEGTPGGEEWLARQIWTLYEFAGVTPEDSTRIPAND